MVSLDDAVLARMEKGGKRYELLVDPNTVEDFKADPESIDLNQFLAMDEVFHDIRGGERPTEEAIENTFGTQDILEITKTILTKGSIQLTTAQRKANDAATQAIKDRTEERKITQETRNAIYQMNNQTKEDAQTNKDTKSVLNKQLKSNKIRIYVLLNKILSIC